MSMPFKPRFITAIATPLNPDDSLHEEGLEIEIADQFNAGIDGLLVAGTMGAMQLLPDETYQQLVRWSLEFADGRGEVLVGAGDTSLGRTLERIRFLNEQRIDGVVVLAPYFTLPTQEELLDYYRALAEASRAPLYLYDIPQVTRAKLEIDTVLRLAEHPNIRGIKCSDEPTYARQLIDLIGDRFRVLMAASLLLDVFLRQGVREHLDGIFCLCPRQIVALGRAAQREDWTTATHLQQELNRTFRLLRARGLWPAFTALMNALGMPGRFRPRPYRQWDRAETSRFLGDAETQAVLAFLSGAPEGVVGSPVRSPVTGPAGQRIREAASE
jgi:4-hydroxy-tetrahydrodipicolinate synthase